MQKTIHIIIIALSSLTISVFPKDNNKDDNSLNWGLVCGEAHAFLVKAPEGWVLDNSSGVNQGVHAAFYPIGGSWEKSPTVMYVHGVDIDTNLTLEDFVKMDIKNFKKNFPGIKTESLDPILIEKEDHLAKVVKFSGGGYQSTDAIAYIKEKKNIPMLVLSTKIPEELNIHYPKFIELVQSYKHVKNYKAIKEKYGLE